MREFSSCLPQAGLAIEAPGVTDADRALRRHGRALLSGSDLCRHVQVLDSSERADAARAEVLADLLVAFLKRSGADQRHQILRRLGGA